MKVTKRQLLNLIREACALESEEEAVEAAPSIADLAMPAPIPAAAPEEIPAAAPEEPSVDVNVPVPEDYQAVRNFLDANPGATSTGLEMVMKGSGASCERSTAQALIDHLQDMLDGPSVEEPIGLEGLI